MKHVRALSWVLVIAALPAAAAPSAPKKLALAECLDLALKNNPEILAARQELEAARGRRLQASALPNPVLSAEAAGLALKKNAGESEINVGLEELIEFPGKRALRRSIGQFGEEAAALDLERAAALVRARVKSAYFRAAASARRLELIDAAEEDLKSYSALAQSRYAALQTSSVDVSRGLIEQLKVKVEAVDARQTLRADLAALFLVMGAPPPDGPPELEALRYAPPTETVDGLLARVAERPSLKADAVRSSRARAGVDLARKGNLPDLTVGLLYPSLRTSGWGFSLGASVPIFTARQKGEVAEAQAIFEASEVARRARLRRIETSVRTVYAEVVTLKEKLDLYDGSLLRESERLIQSALRDYQYGKLDSLGLLDFYRTWREVSREYLDTLLRYIQASAELEVAGEDTAPEE